jgi:hypothetical protein
VVVPGSARLGGFWATLFNTWRRLAKKGSGVFHADKV